MTQAGIADALNVSEAYISLVERGRRPFPVHLAEYLPCQIRREVIEALIIEHEARIDQLRNILKNNTEPRST